MPKERSMSVLKNPASITMGPWSALAISLAVLVCAASGQTLTDPSIVSSPQTVQVNVGSTAVLKCRVHDLGNYQVKWTFISHDFVIYEGNELKTSHPSKYTLLNAHGYIHDLQILDVELTDHGFYMCSAGPASIISHLDVVEMETLSLPDVPDAINITDCCVSKGVSENCLPACYPPDIDLDLFDVRDACGASSDVIGLMECFSAGSNHDTCCLSRGVDVACLELCHGSLPPASSDPLVCLNDVQVNALLSCAVTGSELFPSAPTSVSVMAVNTGSPSILVKWAPPEKNAEAVTGYKIMYRLSTETTYKSILIHDRGMFIYRLTEDSENIAADQGYFVHIVALAKHGISLGSIEIEVYVSDASLHEDMNESVDDCCERRDVNDTCRTMMCDSKTWSEFHTGNALSCLPYLDDVFTCLAGERNHGGCCEAYGVSSECLALCSGTPPSFDSSLIGCVAQMNIIEACVQQGFGTQPAPPKNLKVQHVTNNFASLSFDSSPTSNLTRYTVLLRTRNVTEPFDLSQTLSPTATSFELKNLAEDTYYWVRVIAETEEQGSLPSETVSFLTYSDSYERPVDIPTEFDPYNLKECCVATGMPAVCAEGCVYRPNMTDYYAEYLSTCYTSIGSVLACASDGRDHRSCCRRRKIHPDCLDLCVHTKPGPLDPRFVPTCVPETSKAVLCYSEGLVDLPRYPDVVVTDSSMHTITLNWTHPLSGGVVDMYSVMYKAVDAPENKTITVDTARTDYILQDLQPATAYTINVFSINDNGTSAPSPDITQFTLEDIPYEYPANVTDGSRGRAFWQNITHCCENTVSEACREVCLNKESATDLSDACFKESNEMLACFSDGQDHRLCCEEKNLPSVCLSICAGNAESNSIAQATCMSYTHRDIIFSCFLERQGLLPEAPLRFLVDRSDEADRNVTLSWAAPAFCHTDCYYTVYYWSDTDPDNKMTQETTSTSSVIAVDMEDHYNFLVVAHNSYGSGPPSAMRKILIADYARDVKVYLNGGFPTVDQGMSAILVCSISDFPQDIRYMQVRWIFNNHKTVGGSNRFLRLDDVSLQDEGTYTCEVTDYYTTSSASFYLPIKAVPRFDQMKVDSVPPGVMGSTAKIACWFRGFPDSDRYAWTKDGRKLEQNLSKIAMGLDQRYHTGITSYRIKIANVAASDYGDYSIEVSNKFGSTSCHVRLHNPEDEDVIIVAPPVSNPPECCAKQGVTPLCQELCGYHINVAEVLGDVKYVTCLQYFDTFISCGADGRDHTKCCQDSAVLPFCQAMCRGVVPASVISDQERMLECLGDWEPIMSCMENGTRRIPFSPVDISLSLVNDGKDVIVSWSQPLSAADKVDHYTIFYTQVGSDTTSNVHINNKIQRFRLKNLEPSKHYDIWITSGNKHGNSLPSAKSRIETFSFALNRPTELKATQVSGTPNIQLTWQMKKLVYYYSFLVYYKKTTDKHYKEIHNVHGTSYTLTELDPRVTYLAFVKGIGLETSRPSDIIEFTTLGYGEAAAKETKKDDFDGEKIAIGVGVTVAVIALIAIVLLVLFFVFKSRLVPPKVDDTVAYENPGFGAGGSVKLHGVNDSSFNYGHLEEEGGVTVESQAPQHVYDNTGFASNNDDLAVESGESSSDPPGYENPMYLQVQANSADVSVSDGAGNDSVATLELNQS